MNLSRVCMAFIAFLSLGLSPPLRAQPKAESSPASVQAPLQAPDSAGVMVTFRGEPLFRIQASVGSFSPEARAQAIEARLNDLAANPLESKPALQTTDDGSLSTVSAGDQVLFAVTDADARLAGSTREALAQAQMQIVEKSLKSHGPIARMKALGLAALLVLLVSALAYGLYRLITWVFRRLEQRIEAMSSTWLSRLKFQDFEILSEATARNWLVKALKGLKLLVFVAAGYAYLNVVFSFFPATRGLANRLLNFVLNPLSSAVHKFVAYLPNLFVLVLIFIGVRYTLKLMGLFFGAIQSGKLTFRSFHAEWADPTLKLVRVLVLAFSLVLAFPFLPGSNSDAFKGVSLFVGVLFSLGSSGAVGNVVAGILLTYMRPFKIGDRIQIGDTIGDVVERTALVTRIRTIKNVVVNIPNGTVMSAQVLNYSSYAKDRGLILHTTVTIGYDAPWRQVHELLLSAAMATDGILADPAPFVFQTSLDDFYVSYQINAYTDRPNDMAGIYSELHTHIQDKFNEGGVEILSPHYRQQRDGNMVTIPADYLPSGYQAPAFRVQNITKPSS